MFKRELLQRPATSPSSGGSHSNFQVLPQTEMDAIPVPIDAEELKPLPETEAENSISMELDEIQQTQGQVEYYKVVKEKGKWVKTLAKTKNELIIRKDKSVGLNNKNEEVAKLNAGNYGKQTKPTKVFSYYNEKDELIKQEIQGDHIKSIEKQEFSDEQFKAVKEFYNENAKKEKKGNKGEGQEDWKQCSPAMYYAMNILYGWEDGAKIKSGYVIDATIDGKFNKGIVTLLKEKGKVKSEKKFTAIDAKGRAGHLESALDEEVVGFDSSASEWMESKTGDGGLNFFLGAVSGGYHSITLCADFRFGRKHFYLWDQHGNAATGSSSSFDRTKAHTAKELDAYFLLMMQSWGDGQKNHTIKLFELENQ